MKLKGLINAGLPKGIYNPEVEIELSTEDLFKQLSIIDKFRLKENLDGWIDLPPTEPESYFDQDYPEIREEQPEPK
jgi:hypothetical protein